MPHVTTPIKSTNSAQFHWIITKLWVQSAHFVTQRSRWFWFIAIRCNWARLHGLSATEVAPNEIQIEKSFSFGHKASVELSLNSLIRLAFVIVEWTTAKIKREFDVSWLWKNELELSGWREQRQFNGRISLARQLREHRIMICLRIHWMRVSLSERLSAFRISNFMFYN